jgi:hypothetical protein
MSNYSNITPEHLGNQSSADPTGITVNTVTNFISDTVARASIGGKEATGMFMLSMFVFVLWKSEASIDLYAAVITPAVFVLGNYGWLPYGEGIIYGSILAIATLIMYGLGNLLR